MNRFERIVRNQANFRDHNERALHGGAVSPEVFEEPRCVCECADTDCHAAVPVSDSEYERVRSNPNTFILAAVDHISPEAEQVVEDCGSYVIAEKTRAREVSESRDPRNRTEPCRIVIADDIVEVRMLLKMLIQTEPDCNVVGEAGTGREALEVCEETQPDLVILDLEMPEGRGDEVLPHIVADVPGVRVIVFSGSLDLDYRALARSGAFDVVPKGGKGEVIMSAVRKAAHPRAPKPSNGRVSASDVPADLPRAALRPRSRPVESTRSRR